MGRRSKVERSAAGGFTTWRRNLRTLKDAKALLKESRRILKRHRGGLKQPVAQEIDETVQALEQAYKDKDAVAARPLVTKQDRLLERHLDFARKSAFREYIESIGIAVLIALLLRAFVVEAFKIPSGSMIPTLKVGDHIFVTKFLYGLRVPFTRVKFFARSPNRGDVIVFIFPRDPSKDFIKRIVAVAGDEIEVRDNVVYVNGKRLAKRKLNVPCRYRDQDSDTGERGEIRTCVAFEEQNGDRHYRVIHDVPSLSLDYARKKVPPGHVFVMGDNRDNSHDSRAWGPVPYENIKGKAMIIWWSSGPPEGIRWSRFFDLVHAFGPKQKTAPVQDGLAPSEATQEKTPSATPARTPSLPGARSARRGRR
ncbi:MAG: signal peptidase I [Deltaproteobacteria bacterium]|nr:MAG: signal peptidase I [Pseudomonadota bacterium]PIE65798.1 MAG: signal peptidase I [Deltaproteobacteria bacterium]